MPIGFQFYDNEVERFNQNYGVDFHMGSFDVETWTTDPNTLYKNTFEEYYRTALGKWADGKIESVNVEQMLTDFEYLMRGYRTVLAESGHQSGMSPYGGRTPVQTFRHLKNTVTDRLPQTKAVFAKRRYMEGNLPIREMMAYAKAAIADGREPSLKEATTIASYAMGLKLASQSRTRGWRFLHPVRNNAEKRDYAAMEKMLKKMKDKTVLKAATDAAGRTQGAFGEIKAEMDASVTNPTLFSKDERPNAATNDPNRVNIKVGDADLGLFDTTQRSPQVSTSKVTSRNTNLV